LGINFAKLTSNGLGTITLDATLAIAESEGTAKTLSAPKVIAQEGTPAKISSGEIIKVQATENVKSEDWPAELSLSVTPTSISYNDYITLTVDVSDDARVSDTLKTTKTINTTLMVKSGETIVIGGIIKEKEGTGTTGVPILKDIPFLGWLFKSTTKATEKTELLIFLTPTVLSSPAS
jgi:type IV pilus assembly protein PilQ